jgi:hypothetical protein
MDDDPMPRLDDDAAPQVVRLRGAADILGVLPFRLGFHPTESVVVVCLEGPRRRDRLVMRLDLPPTSDEAAVADELVERVAHVGASAAVVVVYTARPGRRGRLVRASLVQALRSALDARGMALMEALLVRDGRWWSYLCHDTGCCPADGTPLPPEPTPAALRYAAEVVASGETVLPDREALRRTVEPSDHAVAQAVRKQAALAAAQVLAAAAERGGPGARRGIATARLSVLRDKWQRGDRQLPADDAALVVLGLRDRWCRDTAMTAVLDDDTESFLDLLGALVRQADDSDAAPVCTVLGWVAYARGHGALASVAAERALRCEPGYSMAKLLLDGMDRMVTPGELRDVSASVRAGFGLDAVDGWDEDDWDDADWYGEDDWDDPFEAKDTG